MRRPSFRLPADQRGASAVEYGLIAALIAVAAIAGMTNLRGRIITLYNNIATNVQPAM